MFDFAEKLASTNTALFATWSIALVVFITWLIFEFRGVAFVGLIRWKPFILASLRAGFLLSLILPVVLLFVSALAGAWSVLIFALGIWYLPPSIYILCISLGLLYNILRKRHPSGIGRRKKAYLALIVLASLGALMLYVSLVWLDKPV